VLQRGWHGNLVGGEAAKRRSGETPETAMASISTGIGSADISPS